MKYNTPKIGNIVFQYEIQCCKSKTLKLQDIVRKSTWEKTLK